MAKITSMKIENITDAINLWKTQFTNLCCSNSFPNFTDGGETIIEPYLRKQIDNGNAIVAINNDCVIGYMAWMYFDFHNERTAFLPIVGHATSLNDELIIYEEMYKFVSQKWVLDNRFNHLWMTYFDDHILKNCLYDLGFGSYVIDACQSTDKIINSIKTDYELTLASLLDVDPLLEFVNTSTEYYANAPIFLKRDNFTKNKIIELIKNDYVLIAWDNDKIIGAISFSVNLDFDFEQLTTPNSSYIGSIGAFIHSDYRGKGIGTALLEKVFDFCRDKKKSHIHVSFESSNPNAAKFWPKYFKPAIRSVRRTINKDANIH